MAKEHFNKLVRDGIPEYLEGKHIACKWTILDQRGLEKCIREKLVEEIEELMQAGNDAELLEEAVDVVEVVLGWLESRGLSEKAFWSKRMEKKEERGGFSRGIFLEWAGNE